MPDRQGFAKGVRISHTGSMKIFVDARMIGATITRGIGRVVEAFLPRLIRLFPGHEWCILVRYPEQVTMIPVSQNVRVIQRDIGWYGFSEQILVAAMLWRERPAVALFFHWNIPVLWPGKIVTFLHDFLLFHQPVASKLSLRHPWIAKFKNAVQRRLVPFVVWRSSGIGVPTQYVKEDLHKLFPWAKTPVRVVGEGVDLPASAFGGRLKQEPYCLMIGSVYPHKRVDLALRAWKSVAAQHPDHVLVMVGERDVFMRRYEQMVKDESIPRVVFVGRVSDEELVTWCRDAELFVFASSEEGFGLPPLEALMMGCPVLASDAPCLVEVLPKKAVRFFRNGDEADMIEGWKEALRIRTHLVSEIPAAQDNIRARHRWDEAVRDFARLLQVS
jgi:glycosyltransferase involved in cell wall biosynthesis